MKDWKQRIHNWAERLYINAILRWVKTVLSPKIFLPLFSVALILLILWGQAADASRQEERRALNQARLSDYDVAENRRVAGSFKFTKVAGVCIMYHQARIEGVEIISPAAVSCTPEVLAQIPH